MPATIFRFLILTKLGVGAQTHTHTHTHTHTPVGVLETSIQLHVPMYVSLV